MASSSSPYGLRPIGEQSGIMRPLRLGYQPGVKGGIVSGLAQNIFKYQAVRINPATGGLEAVTATNQAIFGVFAGVEFTPVGGRPTESPFWASGQTYDPNFDMLVYIWPAWIPGLRFQIQADGTVPFTLFGSEFNLSNIAAGSTVTGLSAQTVAAAGVVAASQGQLALVEFANDVAVGGGGSSIPGDAFTDLIVTIANPQVGFGPQTSIG